MWRITAAGVLAMLLGVTALSMRTTSVHACSPGPDFDPITEASLVVSGRFARWEIASDEVMAGFQTVRVYMSVDTVYKGNSQLDEVTFIDTSSLNASRLGEDYTWSGSAGACGAFNEDPTGKYGLLALGETEDGTYRSSLPMMFFIGPEPSGRDYESALERMASFPGAATLPSLGSSPAASTNTDDLTFAVAAMGAALLTASFAIRLTVGRRA